MSILFYEVLLALRRLRRRPTPTLLMLATFTVSISLTLIAWSLFHTVYLHNPEFDPKGSLYRVGLTGSGSLPFTLGLTRQDFEALQQEQDVFAEVAGATLYNTTFVEAAGGMERFLSANVSTQAMRMVSATPLLGRIFTPEEDRPGTAPVVLLAEKTWRGRFNAEPEIIGRKLLVGGVPATVVGVMPAAFRFPNDQDLWLPMGFNPSMAEPDGPVIQPVVRLKPGISATRAVQDLRVIFSRRGAESIITRFKLAPSIVPLRQHFLLPEMRSSALILFALALIFIFVGCANAANLVMIDFLGRKGEVASALALGMPRAAVVRGMIFQLLIVASIAASVAYGLLLWFAPFVHSAMARTITPYWLYFKPEWHQVAMAGSLAVFSSCVAAIAPVVYLYWSSPEDLLRDGTSGNRATTSSWWRRGLMVAQIALLTVLAISAGLLTRSNRRLLRDPGYGGATIFASKIGVNPADFPVPKDRLKTHLLLLDELERVPSIAAAGMMDNPIGFSGKANMFFAPKADGLLDGHSVGAAVYSAITPHMFDVLGVAFVEGRPFVAGEAATEKPQVIINASLAQRLWPGELAFGREFFCRYGDSKNQPFAAQVRGVVRDFQAAGPKADINDIIYSSLVDQGGAGTSGFLYARGRTTLPTTAEIRGAAFRVEPRLSIYFPGSLQQVIDTELSATTLTTRLTSAFALAAVILCGVGIYSLTVAQILQRNREFGIRLALGIEPQRLWRHFVRGHLYAVIGGIGLGWVGAVASGGLIASLLYGVPQRDPVIYAAVALVILAVSMIATLPSRRRLCQVNPADCLRSL